MYQTSPKYETNYEEAIKKNNNFLIFFKGLRDTFIDSRNTIEQKNATLKNFLDEELFSSNLADSFDMLRKYFLKLREFKNSNNLEAFKKYEKEFNNEYDSFIQIESQLRHTYKIYFLLIKFYSENVSEKEEKKSPIFSLIDQLNKNISIFLDSNKEKTALKKKQDENKVEISTNKFSIQDIELKICKSYLDNPHEVSTINTAKMEPIIALKGYLLKLETKDLNEESRMMEVIEKIITNCETSKKFLDEINDDDAGYKTFFPFKLVENLITQIEWEKSKEILLLLAKFHELTCKNKLLFIESSKIEKEFANTQNTYSKKLSEIQKLITSLNEDLIKILPTNILLQAKNLGASLGKTDSLKDLQKLVDKKIKKEEGKSEEDSIPDLVANPLYHKSPIVIQKNLKNPVNIEAAFNQLKAQDVIKNPLYDKDLTSIKGIRRKILKDSDKTGKFFEDFKKAQEEAKKAKAKSKRKEEESDEDSNNNNNNNNLTR